MADRKPTVLNPAGYQENLQDTDNLVVEAAPTADNHAVNKEFVDDLKVIIDGDIADAGKWEENDGNLYPKNLTNKVGIGTDNPTRLLTINNASQPQAVLQVSGDEKLRIQSLDTYNYIDNIGQDLVFRGDAGGNQSKVIFKNDGKVGIGTDSPGELLHAQGGGNTTAKISSSRDDRYARLLYQSDNQFVVGYGPNHSSQPNELSLKNYWANGNINFWTTEADGSGTERLTIINNGNVGIGTESPGTTLELGTETPVLRLNGTNNGANVYGDVRSTGNGFEFLSRGGASSFGSYAFYNYNGTTESIALKIKSDGDVGIGTNSPSGKLDVQTAINERVVFDSAGPTSPRISLVRDSGANYNFANEAGVYRFYRNETIEIYRFASDSHIWSSEASGEIARITSEGNVGIGTDDPSSLLTIKGGGTSAGDVETNKQIRLKTGASDNYSGTISWGKKVGDSTYYALAIDAVTNTVASDILLAPSGGNVGIGINNPGVKLDVAGQAHINAPSDFWSGGSYYDVGDLGSLCTHGGYSTSLVSNGYRGADSKWVSLNANGNTGASNINCRPEGKITFCTEANKATGSSSGIAVRATVDDSGLDVAGTISANNFDIGGITKDSYLRKDVDDTFSGNNLTIQGRLSIRGNMDLSDGENLDFGSSDDVRMWYQGSDNYLYCDFRTGTGIIFRDAGTNQIVLEDSGIFRPSANNTTGKIGTSDAYWDEGYFNEFRVNDHLGIGIGTAAPSAPLDVVGTNEGNGVLRVRATVNNPNLDYYFAQEVTATLSGSTATTADREQGGIWVDVNDTATGGDTNHEHRVYGVFADVDCTGDPDLVYGVYGDATVTPSEGVVGTVTGVYGRAEDNGGAGGTSTVVGVRGEAMADNANSDVNNLYGGWFRSTVSNDAGPSTVITGCLGEVEISTSTSASNVSPEVHCVRAEYDNNGDVAQSSNAYLFYGNYSGTLPTNAYGVYITDDVPSIFNGSIQAKSYDIESLPALP